MYKFSHYVANLQDDQVAELCEPVIQLTQRALARQRMPAYLVTSGTTRRRPPVHIGLP